MRYGSVCSGIEAATVAWHHLGWEPAFFSEIEAAPSAVLAHHYPEVPLHGDFTTIGKNEYGKIDLLVGGTPCQSFSVAGLRGGLADDRGNLALEFCRLAQREQPRWIVWENVPGVLSSSGGRDFGSILGALEDLGYGLAYRVLDAQFFGVPQRRRRVFVVGYLGDWRRPAAVLFERHSLSGHPAPRREKGEGTSGRVADSPTKCRAGSPDEARGTANLISAAVTSKWAKGSGGPIGDECQNLIAHALRAEGFDASEDGPGRGTPLMPVAFPSNMGGNIDVGHDVSPALRIAGEGVQSMAVAFSIMPMNSGKDFKARETDIAQPIMAGGPVGGNQGGDYVVPVCFSAKDHGADAMEDCAPTLRAGGHAGSHANAGVMPAVAFDLRGREDGSQFEGPHDTANIRAASGGSSRSYVAASAVRRLTPTECERLQGFPETQKCYTILICRDLSDHQKTNALAALQCRKLPSNVWTAGAGGWTLCAEAAADHFSTSHPHLAPPVAVDVLIDLERQEVRLHSLGKSFSLANNAGGRSEFPLPIGIDSFARLAAALTHVWALAMRDGRAASLANIKASSLLLNGSGIAISFGRETREPVGDVLNAIAMANGLSTSTTLPLGLSTESLRLILTTLSSCVVHAISGCIPAQITEASCYAVRLTTTQGYTLVPYRKGMMADGPRYKALGNSMAVPCMLWLGQRIALVDDLTALL